MGEIAVSLDALAWAAYRLRGLADLVDAESSSAGPSTAVRTLMRLDDEMPASQMARACAQTADSFARMHDGLRDSLIALALAIDAAGRRYQDADLTASRLL
jgi:hypothetical protein